MSSQCHLAYSGKRRDVLVLCCSSPVSVPRSISGRLGVMPSNAKCKELVWTERGLPDVSLGGVVKCRYRLAPIGLRSSKEVEVAGWIRTHAMDRGSNRMELRTHKSEEINL